MSPRAVASRRVGRAVAVLGVPWADRAIIGRLVETTPGGFADLPEWLRRLVEDTEERRYRV